MNKHNYSSVTEERPLHKANRWRCVTETLCSESVHHAIDLFKSLSCCMAKHISINGTIPRLEKIYIRPKKFGWFSQRVRLNVENLSKKYPFFISLMNILCHQSFHPRSQDEIRKLRTIIKVGKNFSRYIFSKPDICKLLSQSNLSVSPPL